MYFSMCLATTDAGAGFGRVYFTRFRTCHGFCSLGPSALEAQLPFIFAPCNVVLVLLFSFPGKGKHDRKFPLGANSWALIYFFSGANWLLCIAAKLAVSPSSLHQCFEIWDGGIARLLHLSTSSPVSTSRLKPRPTRLASTTPVTQCISVCVWRQLCRVL